MSGEEIITAAEEGEVAKVNYLLKKTVLKPESGPLQNAVCCSAQKNHTKVLALLIEWGCPLASKDQSGKMAIHAACVHGAAEAVAVLLARGADVAMLDNNGKSPIDLAIKSGHLNVCRELIRGGADVPKGVEMPGLAQVQREATLDKMAIQLRKCATMESNTEAIESLDTKVWEAQREHMRLLAAQAEMNAGQSLVSLERDLVEQSRQAKESQLSEEALAAQLTEKKIKSVAENTARQEMLKKLDDAEQTQALLTSEDEAIRKELADKKNELIKVQRDKDSADEFMKKAADLKAQAMADEKQLQAEVVERQRINEQIAFELQEAEQELREWMADRDQAAALTAQAHRMLGGQ